MLSQNLLRQYQEILQAYLNGRGEDQLYLGQQLSKWLLAQNISPEEIIDFHRTALENTLDVPELVRDSFALLTEVMIEYGNALNEHWNLRYKQKQLESEIELAVAMQQTLLPEFVPSFAEIEIGCISIPAKQMSGDYYNFVRHGEAACSIAIADIVGKGIPAALCMSMIKYAMDSFYEIMVDPAVVLRHLNRIVEQNIDPSMFITMFYGRYDLLMHRFRYAVAGHEPGFWYRKSENRLYDLEGKGLVLGVTREATYQEYEIEMDRGDVLILLTDGVTERRIEGEFLQREALVPLILEEIHLSAQTMAENIYRKLLYLSNFELTDDHTMIVIRRL